LKLDDSYPETQRVSIVNLNDASFLCVVPCSRALKMAHHKYDNCTHFSLAKTVTF
jgi:hypothetical protein